MARYKITAIVNTAAMDLDHLIDTSDAEAVREYLQYVEDCPTSELQNIKVERIED